MKRRSGIVGCGGIGGCVSGGRVGVVVDTIVVVLVVAWIRSAVASCAIVTLDWVTTRAEPLATPRQPDPKSPGESREALGAQIAAKIDAKVEASVSKLPIFHGETHVTQILRRAPVAALHHDQ